jgi:hypothetical protein
LPVRRLQTTIFPSELGAVAGLHKMCELSELSELSRCGGWLTDPETGFRRIGRPTRWKMSVGVSVCSGRSSFPSGTDWLEKRAN